VDWLLGFIGLKFGLQHPNYTYDGQGPQLADRLRELVTKAESLGFDSFWVMDHLHQIQYVGEPNEPMLEGWTTQSFVASFTSKMKLGTLVTAIVYRHPSILAKIGATLDVLSKGRLFMGIGAAWNVQEATAYGIPFPSDPERLKRLEEAVQIIRKMWTEERTSFDGEYYKIRDAYCNPKPVQKPNPPIMIGGAGERVTLKLVAKYGDACNLFGSPETIKTKLGILREHCKRVGRDYDSILKTKLGHIIIDNDKEKLQARVAEAFKDVPEQRRLEYAIFGTPEELRRQIEGFRDVGIDYFIMNLDPERQIEDLAIVGKEIVNQF
jgi:F420-dependent oxidoreductase-like protein